MRLGSLPAGDYRVEVFASPRPDGPPAETLSFQVREPAEIAVFGALFVYGASSQPEWSIAPARKAARDSRTR